MWLIRLSSDLTTKASNTRKRFQARLKRNIKDSLKVHEIEFTLSTNWSRFYIESDDPRVPELLKHIFAIHSFSPTYVYPLTSLEDVVSQGVELFHEKVKGKTYGVRARRSGNAPFSSMDVNQHLGAALNEGATVNLTNPEVAVHVEVRDNRVFFFSDHLPGPGGLPLATEGRALALMSGGFDSAVAAWMLLKRGVALDYVFFRLGGEAHERDVQSVTKVLSDDWSYGTKPRMYVIPFEDIVTQIQDKTEKRYWQVILKRQMYRTAMAMAERQNIGTLITGEALGQVSSQTLPNLEALNITGQMPILRPLIGFDKNDIVHKAYEIGTGEISATVPEYCALVANRPATGSRYHELDEVETPLEVDHHLLADQAKVIQLRSDEWTTPQRDTVSDLPDDEDAILLDIRNEAEFRNDHDPRATHFDFAFALDLFNQLDKSKTYYIYCNVGLKSANLAERMKQAGYAAFVYQPENELSDVI
jgi:thiamine biosynthesis protein ThiI